RGKTTAGNSIETGKRNAPVVERDGALPDAEIADRVTMPCKSARGSRVDDECGANSSNRGVNAHGRRNGSDEIDVLARVNAGRNETDARHADVATPRAKRKRGLGACQRRQIKPRDDRVRLSAHRDKQEHGAPGGKRRDGSGRCHQTLVAAALLRFAAGSVTSQACSPHPAHGTETHAHPPPARFVLRAVFLPHARCCRSYEAVPSRRSIATAPSSCGSASDQPEGRLLR